MFARCPCCGDYLFILPDGQVTTPAIVTAVVQRHAELVRYEELIQSEEGRKLLAEEIRPEDLTAALDLLDEQPDES